MTEETTQAQPPAKLTKLAIAVAAVTENVTDIQALGSSIEALEKKWSAKTAFAVSTKEGMREADTARKEARRVRLDVKRLRDDSTGLLNNLKKEAWAVADPLIARLDAIEKNAKQQIEAEEQKEATRKAALQEKVNAILRMAEGAGTWTVAQCDERMKALAAVSIYPGEYEEFAGDAVEAIKEVHSILTQAKQAAQHREAEEAARAARERELAALREKEERAARIKAKLDRMKALPAQAAGLPSQEIEVILRGHRAAVPVALHYEEQLEFAELIHAKVERELAALLAEVQQAEAQHAADDGPEVLAPQDDEPTEEDLGFDPLAPVAPLKEAEPFAMPAPRPVPAARPVRRESSPWVEALPEPLQPIFDELPLPDVEEPDLLKAAQDFITTAQECVGWIDEDNIPQQLIAAFRDLKAAVESLSN